MHTSSTPLVKVYPRHDHRLGRKMHLDGRSLPFMVERGAVPRKPRKSVLHEVYLAPLNQRVGSCVANTGAAALAADPIAMLSATAGTDDPAWLETNWVEPLYTDLTKADPFPGAWPPDDTGTDGLTLAKVLRARGLIGSFVHASTLGGLVDLLQHGPVCMGTVWHERFFDPTSDGHIDPVGWADTGVAGGHEFLVRGVQLDAYAPESLDRAVFRCRNSWSAAWGPLGGDFLLNGRTYEILRDDTDLIQLRG